jgi:hypothetical protein
MFFFRDREPTILPSLKIPSCLTHGRWWWYRGICSKAQRLIRQRMGIVRASYHSVRARHYTLIMDSSGRYIGSDEFEAWCGMNILVEGGMVHLGLRKLA